MKRDDMGNIISPKYWSTKHEATYVFKADMQSIESKLNIVIDMLEKVVNQPQLRDFLRPKEVADMLDISRRHVYSLIEDGKIKAYKTGNTVYVDKASVVQYVTHQG